MRLTTPWLVNYLDSILHTILRRDCASVLSSRALLRLRTLALRALLLEVLDHRLVFQRPGGVERGPPVTVRGIDVDALLDDQLHRFESKPLPIAAFGLHPRRPAAHADRRHQRRRHITTMLKAGAASSFDDVIAVMHEA